MNIYYITVTFLGTPIVASPNTTANATADNSTAFVPTSVYFNLTALDWKGNG
jgi:hypothetical protein